MSTYLKCLFFQSCEKILYSRYGRWWISSKIPFPVSVVLGQKKAKLWATIRRINNISVQYWEQVYLWYNNMMRNLSGGRLLLILRDESLLAILDILYTMFTCPCCCLCTSKHMCWKIMKVPSLNSLNLWLGLWPLDLRLSTWTSERGQEMSGNIVLLFMLAVATWGGG